MKKVISAMLSLALVFSLAACGNGNQTAAQSGSQGGDGSQQSVEPVSLKMAVMVGAGTPGDLSAQYFCEEIEARSNGAITIDYYPGGSLGSNDEVTEQLLTGTCDIVWNTLDWYSKLQPDWNVLGLGFAVDSKEHLKAFMDSEKNLEIEEKLRTEQGIRILTHDGYAYPRVVVSTFPINTADDLYGVNMRIPELPLYVKTWSAIGVNCTTLASTDVYMGLKDGIVEAVEFPLGSIFGQSWYEVAPYITYTNHLYAPYVMSMNETSFQKLTPELQELILECAAETAKKYEELDTESVETNVQKMVDAGAILNETPDVDSFIAKLSDTAAECEAEGLWSEGLYEYIQSLR